MADPTQMSNPLLGRLLANEYDKPPEPGGPRPMSLPGRLGEFFGYGGRNEKANELTGMNDRRAFWSGALRDLGGAMISGAPMQGLAQQQVMQQRMARQQQAMAQKAEDIKALNATSTYINAVKDKESKQPSIVQEAQYLFPDDPQAQKDYITKYREKAGGMSINLGDNLQKELISNLPDVHSAAMASQEDLTRYTMMKDLIPLMGQSGVGKDWLTNFRSGLTTIGADGAVQLLDAISESVGGDLFSGDQGATELFRALGNEDVLSRARELYPVSDRDINFLREAMATLRLSDERAMNALIDRRMASAQGKIDQYDWYRQALGNTAGLPPLPELRGVKNAADYGFSNLTPEQKRAMEEADAILREMEGQ